MAIGSPYLLFLGDAADPLAAKTAQGIRDWRPRNCLGQLRLPGCRADLGLADMTVGEAAEAGAKTLVVGVANRGGLIDQAWLEVLAEALERGLNLAAGLHHRLADVPRLSRLAEARGRRLFDVRHPTRTFEVGNGRKRPGKRLLTVGTDCSIGKMYTSLAIEREMRERGMKADFRATGQTGILIAGEGISVDAVVADFISGAAEWLTPANEPDHWDVVEGQGSLFHASFAGVTLGLIHGSQPDALVLCHDPSRTHQRGLPDFPLPDVEECIEGHVAAARLTNPAAACVGLSVITAHMDPSEAERYLGEIEKQLGLPAVDTMRHGVGRIVDRLS
jgi:uncharacterized NAD-dependent epimerase/dehydratase family protein